MAYHRSWITIASSTQEACEAVVLAQSFKGVYTTGKLTIVITKHLASNKELRTLLDDHYDLVHVAEELDFEANQTSKSERARLVAECWKLKVWDRCVLIPSRAMVIKNCDELLRDELKDDDGSVETVAHGQQLVTLSFKPSLAVYHKMMGTDDGMNFLKKYEDCDRGVQVEDNNSPSSNAPWNCSILCSQLMLETDGLADATSMMFLSRWIGLCETFVTKKLTNDLDEFLLKVQKLKSKLSDSGANLAIAAAAAPPKSNLDENFQEAIAVIGVSGRFPGANSVDEYWRNLVDGVDGITCCPLDRPYMFEGKDPESVLKAGFLKCKVDEFDSHFFGISPREAQFHDPQERLLLEVTWECLEDAGINPQSLRGGNTAVYVGIACDDYKNIMKETALKTDSVLYGYVGNAFSSIASRISYFLGLHGPNIALESACSSSFLGLHLACASLLRRETDLALAGGVNIILSSDYALGDGILAKDYRCKTFDESADGFARAESVVSVVLKRFADAVRDQDNILAVIRGSAMNNDGERNSFGTPNSFAHEKIVEAALKKAAVQPADVSYVELHGTGTAIGDPIECNALGVAYSVGRTEPLIIGSVKGTIGHAEAAAGLTALVKLIKCFEHATIPKQLNLTHLNPKLELGSIPGIIPLENMHWERRGGKSRLAGISCFGFSGTNVHVIVEEYNKRRQLESLPPAPVLLIDRPVHLLVLSAKDECALEQQRNQYIRLLHENPDMNVADLAFSANTGRAHLPYRIAVQGRTVSEIQDELSARAAATAAGGNQPLSSGHKKKIAFVFTGQGSQYKDMALSLYTSSPWFRLNFDECDKLFRQHFEDHDLKTVVTNEALLRNALYCQPALFCIEICLLNLWRHSFGVHPDIVLGHSAGEFAAAVAANVLPLNIAFSLVASRAKLVSSLPESSMIAIKCSVDRANWLLRRFTQQEKAAAAAGGGRDRERERVSVGVLNISVINNAADQVVLSGSTVDVQNFRTYCKTQQIKCSILDTTHGYHSHLMDPIMEQFRAQVKHTFATTAPQPPQCEYLSGTCAQWLRHGSDFSADYWVRHLRDTVQFSDAAKMLVSSAADVVIEIGPNPTLLAIILGNTPKEQSGRLTLCPSLRKGTDDWSVLLRSLGQLYTTAGVDVDWDQYDAPYALFRKRIQVPKYPFQRQTYWAGTTSSAALPQKMSNPLLGTKHPNPTGHDIFEKELTAIEFPFIKQRRDLGKTYVDWPLLVEMILAAVSETLRRHVDFKSHPLPPLKPTNVTIGGPLVELGDYKYASQPLQIVVSRQPEEKHSDSSTSSSMAFTTSIYNMNDRNLLTSKVATASFTIPGNQDDGFDSKTYNNNNASYKKNAAFSSTIDQLISKFRALDTRRAYRAAGSCSVHVDEQLRLREVWVNSNSTEILCKIPVPVPSREFVGLELDKDKDKDKYVCHPLILAAMSQMWLLGDVSSSWSKSESESESDGQVVEMAIAVSSPVSFESIVWESTVALTEATDLYGYSITTADKTDAFLLSETGAILASLLNVGFSTKTYPADSGLQDSGPPSHEGDTKTQTRADFYEDVWRPAAEPQLRIDCQKQFPAIDKTFKKRAAAFAPKAMDDGTNKEIAHSATDRLVYYSIIKAFYELGWTPSLTTPDEFSFAELTSRLLHNSESSPYLAAFRQFLNILVEEGILEVAHGSDDQWRLCRLPPTLDQITDAVQEQIHKIETVFGFGKQPREFEFILGFAPHLADILAGKTSPHEIMFAVDETSRESVYKVYESGEFAVTFNPVILGIVESLAEAAAATNADATLKILEIGAGTGGTTVQILNLLTARKIKYEYMFTDIGKYFLKVAETTFAQVASQGLMQFQVLDIERHPSDQGFIPFDYDIVIATNVLHATQYLSKSLTHALQLLRQGGYIIIGETFKQARWLNLSFGLLDGWWRFQDFDVRQDGCLITHEKWEQVLQDSGFTTSTTFGDSDNSAGIVVARAGQRPRIRDEKCWVIVSAETGEDNKADAEGVCKQLEDKLQGSGFKTVVLDAKNRDSHSATIIADGLQVDRIEGVIYLKHAFTEADSSPKFQPELVQSLLRVLQDVKCRSIADPVYNCRLGLVTTSYAQISGRESDSDSVNTNGGPLWGLLQVFAAENGCSWFCLDLDPNESDECLKAQQIYNELMSKYGCHGPSRENMIAYRGGQKYVSRLCQVERELSSQTQLAIPATNRFEIFYPQNRDFTDLIVVPKDKPRLGSGEVEVEIHAAAVNLRDVLTLFNAEDLKQDLLNNDRIGIDIAGVVKRVGSEVTRFKVGDEVFGVKTERTPFPTHTVVHQDGGLFKIPASMTFGQAATIPSAFITASYSLVSLANLKQGDKILIHGAAGGVGLAAVQLAASKGATIFATAGSARKRNYLRSIGVQHVYNSRDTKYSTEILRDTNGKGVDVVLNSITALAYRTATLATCATNARFCEIGRLNIWKEVEMATQRPDVQYYAIDITKFLYGDGEGSGSSLPLPPECLAVLETGFADGRLTPLPYTSFPYTSLRTAVRYLQSCAHIGKVIVQMPITRQTPESRFEHNDRLFNRKSTYLITGGLGGIGLELTKWMLASGAQNIVLSSRSPPKPEARRSIECLQRDGHKVSIIQADISDARQCAALLKKLNDSGSPPLRGIMHAAGLLSDGLVENQTWETLNEVYKPKICGAWNLHTLTAGVDLEYFVLFSSMSSMLNISGQSNHSGANKYLNSLADYRRSQGLVATCVRWGAWSEIGAAASASFSHYGIGKFNPRQGIDALRYVLSRNLSTQLAVINVFDWNLLKMQTNQGNYFEEIVPTNECEDAQKEFGGQTENFVSQLTDGGLSLEDKTGLAHARIDAILKSVLRLGKADSIDKHRPFVEYGLDSLMTMEVKNMVQASLGHSCSISKSTIENYNTITKLAEELLRILGVNEEFKVSA